MNSEHVRAAYDEWHRALPRDEEAAMPWHTLVREAIEPSRDLREKVILEVGCGRGEFSRWLASHPQAPRLVAAGDFSRSAITKARGGSSTNDHARLGWQVCDIINLPHQDATFDTVISMETVEHVPAPARAFAELARVLKPGGRLYLTTPNYLGVVGAYRLYRRLVGRPFTEAGQPINNFMTLPRTLALAKRAGFCDLRTDGVGHLILIPGRAPLELKCLERRPWRRGSKWLGLYSLLVATKP